MGCQSNMLRNSPRHLIGVKEFVIRGINILELPAIWLALQCWITRLEGNPVRIQADHSTSVTYINHKEGVLCAFFMKLICYSNLFSIILSILLCTPLPHSPGRLAFGAVLHVGPYGHVG